MIESRVKTQMKAGTAGTAGYELLKVKWTGTRTRKRTSAAGILA